MSDKRVIEEGIYESFKEGYTTVTVKFIDDGVVHTCPLHDVKRTKLVVGDIRKVQWDDGQFYAAVVKKIEGNARKYRCSCEQRNDTRPYPLRVKEYLLEANSALRNLKLQWHTDKRTDNREQMVNREGRRDGNIEVEFKQDKLVFVTSISSVKGNDKIQKGDTRLVKWTNGKYYRAKLMEIDEPISKTSKDCKLVLPKILGDHQKEIHISNKECTPSNILTGTIPSDLLTSTTSADCNVPTGSRTCPETIPSGVLTLTAPINCNEPTGSQTCQGESDILNTKDQSETLGFPIGNIFADALITTNSQDLKVKIGSKTSKIGPDTFVFSGHSKSHVPSTTTPKDVSISTTSHNCSVLMDAQPSKAGTDVYNHKDQCVSSKFLTGTISKDVLFAEISQDYSAPNDSQNIKDRADILKLKEQSNSSNVSTKTTHANVVSSQSSQNFTSPVATTSQSDSFNFNDEGYDLGSRVVGLRKIQSQTYIRSDSSDLSSDTDTGSHYFPSHEETSTSSLEDVLNQCDAHEIDSSTNINPVTHVETSIFLSHTSTATDEDNSTVFDEPGGVSHQKSNPAKKIKKNKNFCFYCETEVLDFARHLFRNHSAEIDVQKAMATPKGYQRNVIITDIRKKGNYINASSGNYKPMKKLQNNSPNKLAPCPFCKGYYSRRRLWRHKKTCNQRNNIPPVSTNLANLFSRDKRVHKDLIEKVFPRMQPSHSNMVAKKDPLICAYGSNFLKTHREIHQVPTCARKMRELAMVVIEIQKLDPKIHNLLQALKPENFDNLVQAAKNAAGFNEENGTFRDAAYAMNVSTSFKTCCELALINALKNKHKKHGDDFKLIQDELNTTTTLLKSQWKSEVSHQAADNLHAKKMNKVSIVPLASDLKILRDFLITNGALAAEALKRNPTDEIAHKNLIETSFCRTMLLCRKRPGELQRLQVSAYIEAKERGTSSSYEEFEKTVSPTEGILLKTFLRVVVKGKRRSTPVLFSPDVQKHIDLLISVRRNFLSDNNPYLFGQAKSEAPIQGYKVVQNYAKLAKCKRPNSITTRTLRKHLATICQLFSMSDEDVEQLSNFMGHTVTTHRQNYRLPDDVFQTSRITKILLMMEKGQGQQFKGMSLDEMNIDLEDDYESDNSVGDESFGDSDIPLDDLLAVTRKDTTEQRPAAKPTLKKKREIHKWTEEQKNVVKEYFKSEIKSKTPARKHQVEKLYKLFPELGLPKEWTKVKVFVQNSSR